MFYLFNFLENLIKFIRMIFKKIYWKLKYGKRIKIGRRFKFRKGMKINISKKGYLEIGDNTFFNNGCSINCKDKIIIGESNLFGEDVKIYDHNHIFNRKDIDKTISYNTNQIKIGNNNWFGSDVIILSKCEIGDNNVVAANTVLNEKIDSDFIIKNENKILKEKIVYKEEK